jgi:NTE family protein
LTGTLSGIGRLGEGLTMTSQISPAVGRNNASRATASLHKSHHRAERPPFARIALVLQGGGALGAYQAGVYQGLDEAGLHPDWVAGISIGAVNAALIAGNPPEKRAERLRAFWETVTPPHVGQALWPDGGGNHLARGLMSRLSSAGVLVAGVPNFFSPRLLLPWLHPPGGEGATSFYDTAQLKSTLERLVDFDRINHAGAMRLSLGAVNVRTGNFVYFDTDTHTIRPEHVMASGALPPGFPAVEIDGEHYWDGGVVSNTPLDWVVEARPAADSLIFQVDLWNARGTCPRTMAEVATRQKEIQYSSRTRLMTDRFHRAQTLHNAMMTLVEKLPAELMDEPEVKMLLEHDGCKHYNIIHLIYRSRQYEWDSKDYDFSRASMEDHWRVGYNDTVRTLRHPEVLERHGGDRRVFVFDLGRDGRE